MRSDVNVSLVEKLIKDGDRKMKDSEEAVLSGPETIIEDALKCYKKAQEQDPNNKIILKRIEIAEARKKEMEKIETKPSPNRRP